MEQVLTAFLQQLGDGPVEIHGALWQLRIASLPPGSTDVHGNEKIGRCGE